MTSWPAASARGYPAQAQMGELREPRLVVSVSARARVWEGLPRSGVSLWSPFWWCGGALFSCVPRDATGTQGAETVVDEAISGFRATRCGVQGSWKRQKKELSWCVTGLNDLAGSYKQVSWVSAVLLLCAFVVRVWREG